MCIEAALYICLRYLVVGSDSLCSHRGRASLLGGRLHGPREANRQNQGSPFKLVFVCLLTWHVLFCFARQNGEFSFANEPWHSVRKEIKTLIQSMLVVDPVNRATAAEIRRNDWVLNGWIKKPNSNNKHFDFFTLFSFLCFSFRICVLLLSKQF